MILTATCAEIRATLDRAETRLNQSARRAGPTTATELRELRARLAGLGARVRHEATLIPAAGPRLPEVGCRLVVRLGILAGIVHSAAGILYASGEQIKIPPGPLDELAVMWGEVVGPARWLLAEVEGHAAAAQDAAPLTLGGTP